MSAMASQITSLTIVYWTIYSVADQIKHQSSMSLAFVRGIHQWPVNSPHKGPVIQKMFPFDDVIMRSCHPFIKTIIHHCISVVRKIFHYIWWALQISFHDISYSLTETETTFLTLWYNFVGNSRWWFHDRAFTWTSWHMKSLATQWFVQQLVQANNKINIEVPHYWPFLRRIHRR